MNSNYTPKGPSRQEAAGRANRIKTSTIPTFATREDGYFSCEILGHEVKLRFDHAWTAYCPDLDIEILFTNRGDEAMIVFMNDWLTAPQRQATPPVLYLAEYHDIPASLAERGR